MADAHYEVLKLAKIYDAGNGWSKDRDFYLSLADETQIDILDLGCGTGLLCDSYADKGHRVTGVDPAKSMLEVARKKTNGSKIDWINSQSQDFITPNKFDLIIMTGHAFQVLLTEDEVLRTFKNVRNCLKPNGKFVFETRNPQIDWGSQWNTTKNLNLDIGKVSIYRNLCASEGSFIEFETQYIFPDETLTSKSKLRFWKLEEITKLLNDSSLKTIKVNGDWDGGIFYPESSDEIIFTVGSNG
ncbi:MAG: class I SAM-dependent methyltransferase [Bdellovibrionota bacterium]